MNQSSIVRNDPFPPPFPFQVELARLLRRHTPMTRQWIAGRLHMGSASYVSHLTKPQ